MRIYEERFGQSRLIERFYTFLCNFILDIYIFDTRVNNNSPHARTVLGVHIFMHILLTGINVNSVNLRCKPSLQHMSPISCICTLMYQRRNEIKYIKTSGCRQIDMGLLTMIASPFYRIQRISSFENCTRFNATVTTSFSISNGVVLTRLKKNSEVYDRLMGA